MFNVCPRCGQYRADKVIDARGPTAVCPLCGYAHPFLQLPLFVLSGASGAGKTTVGLLLVRLLPECVVLDSDILWGAVPATADANGFRNTWLRVAKNVGQAGWPVVLVGTALPDEFETCVERRYFRDVHYLALVCDDALLAQRLQRRPAWRGSAKPEVMARMAAFNAFLRAHGPSLQPPIDLVDTSGTTIEESAHAVVLWIRARL